MGNMNGRDYVMNAKAPTSRSNMFYFIVFLLSLAAMFLLPSIFAVISAIVYDAGHPGFLMKFSDEIQLPISKMSDITLSIHSLSQFLGSFIIAVAFIFIFKHELGRQFKRYKENLGRNIGYTFLWFFLLLAVTVAVSVLFEKLGISTDAENQAGIEALIYSRLGYLIIVTTAVLAPFVEELIFRKLTFNILEKSFSIPSAIVVIISAGFFAVLHDYTILFFLYFPLALVLSASYSVHKNNIFVPMSVHFLNNIFSLIGVFLMI